MRTVVDIPDSALLATNTLGDLVGQVTSVIGVDSPDVICVPMIDFGGANFRSRKIDRNIGHWSGYNLESTVEGIRSKFGAQVYLSIIAPMNFLDGRPFLVRDQYGDDKVGVCISNPHIQRLLRSAIQEAVDLYKPAGIVLDICDINGQNARSGRIEFTCFCSYCVEALRELGKFDYSVFKSHPNPINLVLKDSGTGIQHFNINLQTTTEDEIILLSRIKGIFDDNWIDSNEKAASWARTIKHYLEARSRTTAEALRSIFEETRRSDIRTAVISGSPRFDHTVGVDLEHMQGCVDEFWTDTDDLRETEIPAGIDVYHYLFGRARYSIDAYFELASDRDKLESIAAGFTSAKSDIRDLLEERSQKLLKSSQVKLVNVSAIEEMGAFSGIVAPPLNQQIMQKINDRVLEILPNPRKSKETAGAADVLILLMQLVERGTPITIDILQQVARRLGVFDQE